LIILTSKSYGNDKHFHLLKITLYCRKILSMSCQLTHYITSMSYIDKHIVLSFCFDFLRLVYPMLPVSLDFPFLIAPSVLSNVYLYKYTPVKAN
jgi:hypothetical protein